jgi:hypothetical protein
MADFSYDYGSYDYAPETDYYSQQEVPDGADAGYQNWSDWFSAPEMSQSWTPEQSSSALVSEAPSEYGFDTKLAEPPPPSVGGMGGSGMPRGAEDDWLKQLGKAGIGMGVGVGTQALGGILSNMMAPKPQKPQAMPGPAGGQYTPEPLAPLPGTQASPLIKPRPTNVKLSQGLEEKRPRYGGFSMY